MYLETFRTNILFTLYGQTLIRDSSKIQYWKNQIY